MRLRNVILSGLLLGMSHGMTVKAHEKVEPFTMGAMGCMLLRECTENVRPVNSIQDIKDSYPDVDYSLVADEFNSMVESLRKVGVGVFLADSKWFPPGNRGVYHTVGNNFFLNDAFMHRQGTLMSVTRHEGWHAAQDCMAGTIDNSLIALILPEEKCLRFGDQSQKKRILSLHGHGKKRQPGQVKLRV